MLLNSETGQSFVQNAIRASHLSRELDYKISKIPFSSVILIASDHDTDKNA